MGLLKEFRDFALRGNVIDMAVGVIIGGAFGKIVTSMTNDLIMPLVGRVISMGGHAINFKDKYYALVTLPKELEGAPLEALQKKSIPVIAYGSFLQTTLDFVILAFCIFMMIKLIQVARAKFETKKADSPPAAPPADVVLLTEIRDLLAKK